jgi:alpha/beta superfamily hydrolase
MTGGPTVEDIVLEAGDGVSLHGRFTSPAQPMAACVMCHPHPQHGGSMHNPLLLAIEDDVCGRGAAVLRFDFRGVGRSSGSYDHGVGEVADVAAAVDAAAAACPGVPLFVGGWSFGAGVSHAYVSREDPRRSRMAWFGIAPVLTFGSVADHMPVPGSDRGDLVVVGSMDQFVEADSLADSLPPTTQVEVIAGCDHFFADDCGSRVASLVGRFVAGGDRP